MSADRLPPLPEACWTDAQRACAHEIINGPRGALVAPFVPLLRSPELAQHAQRMGEYLRYRSALGQRLSELAILLTARAWSQPVEWAIHAPIAEREGVAASTVRAISEGRRPEGLAADEQIVWDFHRELVADRGVSDLTWARAIDAFGERGTVDLLGILGYYTFLALVMNAARTAVPGSRTEPPAPLEPGATPRLSPPL